MPAVHPASHRSLCQPLAKTGSAATTVRELCRQLPLLRTTNAFGRNESQSAQRLSCKVDPPSLHVIHHQCLLQIMVDPAPLGKASWSFCLFGSDSHCISCSLSSICVSTILQKATQRPADITLERRIIDTDRSARKDLPRSMTKWIQHQGSQVCDVTA